MIPSSLSLPIFTMTQKTSKHLFPLFFVISCFLSIKSNGMISSANKNLFPKVRGMFVFGSSLVDNGNNNFLPNTLAKVNYLPYGLDFPLGLSGRFTNGKNVIDLLGELLQLPPYLPPFADPTTKGSKILNGVNFASGASGILDDTGRLARQVFTLNQQIENFKNVTLPDLEKQLGVLKTRLFLRDFLFIVGTGGNDYSFNYFINPANSNVSVESFTANLTATFSRQLKRIYDLGARKFVLISVNPNGCIPFSTALHPEIEGCVQSINKAVQLFNNNLSSMVFTSKLTMPGSHLVYLNSYKIIRDIIKDPASKGFTDAKTPCCKVASLAEGGTGIFCNRAGTTCTNRSTYLYFDGLHPTEAVNVVIANKAFNSDRPEEVYPINVKQLTEI